MFSFRHTLLLGSLLFCGCKGMEQFKEKFREKPTAHESAFEFYSKGFFQIHNGQLYGKDNISIGQAKYMVYKLTLQTERNAIAQRQLEATERVAQAL